MTKIERMKNMFEMKPVDKVPVSFWFHFTGDKKYGDEYVKFHLAYYRATNVDFVKMMNDAFAPYPIDIKITKSADWRSLRPKGKNNKYIRDQAEYAARLNDALQGECMTFWTIFAPFTSIRQGSNCSDAAVTQHLKDDPESVIEGIKAVAQDCMDIAELCTGKGGCTGLYMPLASADVGRFSREQYDKWIKPQDLTVAAAMNAVSKYNIAHLCGWSGVKNNTDWWKDYPLQLMHWAANIEDVTWEMGAEYFCGKPRMGGFDNRQQGILYSGSEAEIRAETRRLINISGTKGVVLGGDCTVPMDIDYIRIRWVVEETYDIK